MANYLVTGAAGFIANKVIQMLIADGHTVVGIDNLNDAYDVRLKRWRLEQLKPLPGFLFHQFDICDRPMLAKLFAGELFNHTATPTRVAFDAIINLAARSGVRQSVENPWEYVNTNITGTLNLLEMCRHHQVQKFVLASTSSLYGAHPPLPTPETAESDHPLQAYAATKKGAEMLCHSYHHLFDLDITIFRYFTVYGPAGRPEMVMFRFCQWIAEGRPVTVTGDGSQSRGFTYVDDIARGTILGLQPLGYELINLGGHETMSINHMIALLENYLGKKADLHFIPAHKADVLQSWASVEKARQLLGWEPQVHLEEGVKRLVDWYLANRSWAKDIILP